MCIAGYSIKFSFKLNYDKTEFIIIGTKQQRHKLSNHFPVKLLDNDICPSDSVRNLAVVFDSDFSFHKHVSNICKSCFYHIRDLRRIRRHIPLSTAKTISNALISSRLDYCNSLLNNIAKQDLSKLQRVQNCLARVVLRAPRFSRSLPLSASSRIRFLPVQAQPVAVRSSRRAVAHGRHIGRYFYLIILPLLIILLSLKSNFIIL